MDTITDADAKRLHELRLRGFLPAPDESQWDDLHALGLVDVKRARVMLTPAGRDAHARWAQAEPGSEADTAAEAAYTSFLPLNQKLLKVCHDWQLGRGGIPNDHSDPGYDDRVIGRLRGVHSGARRVLADLVPAIPRFGGYEARFDHALGQLDTGARQWFASPACDSYHTVWMQFHEDLLLAGGRSRADEEMH
jgi:hypothetical protein